MSDNPVESAANELKKWLEQLKKIMAMMEAQEKAKIAEQKAIGDKALEAHKEMVQKSEWTELRKQQAEALKLTKENADKLRGLDSTNTTTTITLIEREILDEADQLIEDVEEDISQAQDLDETPDDFDLDSEEVDELDVEGDGLDMAGDGLDMGGGGLDMGGGGGLAQGLQKGVEGLQKGVEGLEKGIEGLEKGIEGAGKQSTGEAMGWKKGEKGWQNGEGVSVKELSNGAKVNANAKVNIGSARGLS